MTDQAKGAPGWGGCPDPEQIAAHAERRLTPDEAARLDEHIAGCADCYGVYAETLQFRLEEDKSKAQRAWGARVLLEQPLFKIAAAVLLATGVAVTLYQLRSVPPRGGTPLVADLARAMGDRRFIEPRLTGGFEHGRLIVLRSVETPKGLDAQSPAVLAAVAKIRERAEGDTSPETLGALGVTYLVSGDIGAAVKALESATAQAPENPRLWSDLAAAYLARAKQTDEPADIPKALESAEKAIALPEPPQEAWFNRALALEALHLTDAARKAWQDYLDRDAASDWADEARQHLEALAQPRKSSAEEDKARVQATLEEGAEAIDRLATSSPSLLRDYLEDELLPAWAEAHLVGHPDEKTYRELAALVGEALLRATGDEMARQTAAALLNSTAALGPHDPLRSQALGFRAYREAKRLFDLRETSCPQSRDASRGLADGGSPYAAWARLWVVIACLFPAEPQPALAELGYLESLAENRGYPQLLGRVRWIQGVFHANQGQLTASRERYWLARENFQKTLDAENEASILVLLAEDLQFLGESEAAWRDREQALALLAYVTSPRRRHTMLLEAALACRDAGQPRSALHFATALVETALGWSRPPTVSEALLHRAGILHSLGADERAASDLRESRSWISRIKDETLMAKQKAEADAIEGEILLERQPDEAARFLEGALTYFRATSAVRLAPLHLSLARAKMAQGLDEAAEAQLLAGVEVLEELRISQKDAHLQTSFFDQASSLFDEIVRFEVTKRHDPERALAFVERGLARQLVDSLRGGPAAAEDGSRQGVGAIPFAPEAIRRDLPDGLALVYYLSLDERLLTWVLTRRESQFLERALPLADLSRLVAAHRRALESRASLDAVQRTGARLHDELVRPLAAFLVAQRTLIFVPDQALQLVPFASLWDRDTGRYLVEDHLLGATPSGTVFVRASAAAALAARRRVSRALVVGNPRLDRRFGEGLPNLPGAEREAAEVAGLYARSVLLTGSDATKAGFLNHLRSSEVAHYAGHAASSMDNPATARLFLAPDLGRSDPGILYLHELTRGRLPRTRVVVLAACHSGEGQVSRLEGTLSLGRPFLAAGVPSVVVSRWGIDDSVSQRFFVTFHRALLARGDALVALRDAQVALLRDHEASLAHPGNWAAFVHMGGFDPHSFSKGEVS